MTDTPLPATFTRSYNMKKILFTICGRAGSKGVAGKNLKTIYKIALLVNKTNKAILILSKK